MIPGHLRRLAITLMRRGFGGPSEVAEAMKLPRMTVHRWGKAEGIDWKAAQLLAIQREIERRSRIRRQPSRYERSAKKA